MWPIVSEEKQEERRKICDSCDKKNLGICTECNCVIALKTKMKKTRCPLRKW